MSQTPDQWRVQFDFDIEFLNGGGLKGEGFRLDIEGDDISDEELGRYIVRDLRLLMVGRVQISNKQLIRERHKRTTSAADAAPGSEARLIELSHVIGNGLVTYKGLPAPIICDYLSHERSRSLYAAGTEFQIGAMTLVANTGTYIDSPFHRYADGEDIAALDLRSVTELDGVVVRLTGMQTRAIPAEALAAVDVRGKAVLLHTGWAAHWGADAYFEGHPFLTAAAARYLRDQGAALVGIDSLNVDDTEDPARPAHTFLLGARIPIVEHLHQLELIPDGPFRFCAAPVRVSGMGTFPVRAYARVEAPR